MTSDAGKRLIAKLAELQAMFAHLRSYSGPFDPQFPRTVFHLLFCPPLHCSIDPIETLGVIQRIFHSKDGKYLAASFGRLPRFWRDKATAEDLRAITLLREIRQIAREHRVWATYVDGSGSWFPKYSYVHGVLQPSPGDPIVVSFDDYLVRLSEYDMTDPPTPGSLLSSAIDAHSITRVLHDSELVVVMPEKCRACVVDLLPRDPNASVPSDRYLRDTRQCPACLTIYVREPADSELTADEIQLRNERQVVMAEFLRRIEEEFPPPKGSISAEDIVAGATDSEPDDPFDLFGGQTFGTEGESWRGAGE